MPTVVKKVSTSKEMRTFLNFANKLYRKHPYYVPNLISDDAATLDRSKNFAFEFCEAEYFLAWKDGKVAGRVAAIINHKANEAWKVRQVRFGWIDFIEDIEVLEALLQSVTEWGRERGMTDIAGPLGFTDFDPEGMLVEGFDKMGTMITISSCSKNLASARKSTGWNTSSSFPKTCRNDMRRWGNWSWRRTGSGPGN